MCVLILARELRDRVDIYSFSQLCGLAVGTYIVEEAKSTEAFLISS